MTADERRTGPPTGHPDLDTLADLHAGAVAGADAERVRGHVAGCRQCAGALEALDAVRGQLRSLPVPTMPAAVAARLDATVADLRTNHTAPAVGPAPPSVPDPEDELAEARVRRDRRRSRAIVAAAAAVVVIAAGGAIASTVRGSGGSSETAAGGGSAVSAPAQPQQPNGLTPKSADDGSVGTQAALPAYDRAGLRAALPTIVARGVTPRAAGMDPARRAACAGSIPGVTGSLRGVERIVYRGQPAFVFVYADGAELTGYVVTEACGGAAGRPATVLDTVS